VKLEIRERDRRALWILGAALVLYALADFVALPLYDRMADAALLAADNESQLRRYRRAELRKGQYAELLKTAEERIRQSESVMITAANASLASAELQSLVEGVGEKVGLMVGQRQIGNPRRLNELYADLPMTLNFESTPGQLVAFLSELRSLPRFVTVRSMQVTPVAPVFEAPKGADLTKNVRVNVTIAALTSATLVRTEGVRR
jgi:Tfp pilus assembly protein PilO